MIAAAIFAWWAVGFACMVYEFTEFEDVNLADAFWLALIGFALGPIAILMVLETYCKKRCGGWPVVFRKRGRN